MALAVPSGSLSGARLSAYGCADNLVRIRWQLALCREVRQTRGTEPQAMVMRYAKSLLERIRVANRFYNNGQQGQTGQSLD